MMKFAIRSVRDGCRIGVLSVSKFERDLETPLCLLYTRSGSVPYITKDLLNKIENIPDIASMPLPLLVEHQEIVEKCGGGIGKFASMQEKPIFCTVQDSGQSVPVGYNDNAGISLWGRGGKVKVNEDSYMKTIKSFQPHFFQALCDSDTNETSSRKRVRKSVDRTVYYLDRCLAYVKDHEAEFEDKSMFGVIQGGFFVEDRVRSAKETASRSVAGFSVEGFYNFGVVPSGLTMTSLTEIIQQTLKHLPEDKPRHLPGAWTPFDIVIAVRLGFDLFDSSYAYLVTERNSALVFHWDRHCKGKMTEKDDVIKSCSVNNGAENHLDSSSEINLQDKKYFADKRPILEGCTCYSCANHTRAYIHHLIVTSELLAGVLIMIHNLHHYFSFFKFLRQAVKDGCTKELEAELRIQFPLLTADNAEDKKTSDEKIETEKQETVNPVNVLI